MHNAESLVVLLLKVQHRYLIVHVLKKSQNSMLEMNVNFEQFYKDLCATLNMIMLKINLNTSSIVESCIKCSKKEVAVYLLSVLTNSRTCVIFFDIWSDHRQKQVEKFLKCI